LLDGKPDLTRDWWGIRLVLVMSTPAMMVMVKGGSGVAGEWSCGVCGLDLWAVLELLVPPSWREASSGCSSSDELSLVEPELLLCGGSAWIVNGCTVAAPWQPCCHLGPGDSY